MVSEKTASESALAPAEVYFFRALLLISQKLTWAPTSSEVRYRNGRKGNSHLLPAFSPEPSAAVRPHRALSATPVPVPHACVLPNEGRNEDKSSGRLSPGTA